MVNSKKMNKSTVAVIVLALLLVLSLVLTATGAWFTDKAQVEDKGLAFGTLDIDSVTMTTAAKATNTIDTDNVSLMPGSTISGTATVTLKEGSAAAWLRYKITFSGEGAEYIKGADGEAALSTEYVYVANAVEGGATSEIEISAKVPTSVQNAAQGKAVTITIEVEAIQQANTAATNSADIWAGVTVEEVTHA